MTCPESHTKLVEAGFELKQPDAYLRGCHTCRSKCVSVYMHPCALGCGACELACLGRGVREELPSA